MGELELFAVLNSLWYSITLRMGQMRCGSHQFTRVPVQLALIRAWHVLYDTHLPSMVLKRLLSANGGAPVYKGVAEASFFGLPRPGPKPSRMRCSLAASCCCS